MKNYKYVPDVVDLAWQVIAMQQKIEVQEAELHRLQDIEQKYIELLNGSIAHGQKMAAGMLAIAMTPGVVEAIAKHNGAEVDQ